VAAEYKLGVVTAQHDIRGGDNPEKCREDCVGYRAEKEPVFDCIVCLATQYTRVGQKGNAREVRRPALGGRR